MAKLIAITQALNEVLVYHKLDLTSYDGCDVESVGRADNDLIRPVYDARPFPFLESLWSSNRVKIFEEIIFCLVDEDEDYRRVKAEQMC